MPPLAANGDKGLKSGVAQKAVERVCGLRMKMASSRPESLSGRLHGRNLQISAVYEV